MTFLKLSKEDTEQLFNFLVKLKHDNWIVTEPSILMEIYEWHIKITGFICQYEGKNYNETAFCHMTKDLADYFKKEIINEKKQKCPRCRRLKTLDSFLGNKYCKECRKKKIPTRKNR